jgi:hypothetical protein
MHGQQRLNSNFKGQFGKCECFLKIPLSPCKEAFWKINDFPKIGHFILRIIVLLILTANYGISDYSFMMYHSLYILY